MVYMYFCFFSAGFKICTVKIAVTSKGGAASVASTSSCPQHAQTLQNATGCHVRPAPGRPPQHALTWNEHINVSSTLIMAPALSNSPQ